MLTLAVSSYCQVASGYVDVFSHRFIFRTVDPVLNPAHVSLYAASPLGFYAVYLGLWSRGDPEGKRIVRPGMLIALAGVSGEIVPGVLNEAYHRLFADTPVTTPAHLAIHGFVISMFVVATGGLISISLLQNFFVESGRKYVGASFGILFSSAWMLLVGSAMYLSGFFPVGVGGVYLLMFGGLLASSVAVSALLICGIPGLVSVAVLSFFLVNAVLLYGFEGVLYLLPVPVLAGAAGEFLAKKFRKLSRIRFSALAGAIFGALAYWLLYPYSYSFFSFASIPAIYFGIGVVAIALSGAIGGGDRVPHHKERVKNNSVTIRELNAVKFYVGRGDDMSSQRAIGIVGAAGLVIQIALGFYMAGTGPSSFSSLLVPLHMVIGLGGIALVAYIVARAFYVASAGLKFLYLITFVLVLAQVALGFRILGVNDEQLVMTHQGAGFAILVLLGLSEMLFARQRRAQGTSTAVKTAK